MMTNASNPEGADLSPLARIDDPVVRTALGPAAPPVMGFIASVEHFLGWARSEPGEPEAEARLVFRLLADLCREVLLIPDAAPSEDKVEIPRADDHEWRRIYERAAALPVQYYSVVFDPLEVPPSEAVVGDLADDLADIYRDLDYGHKLYEAGEHAEAAWQWRFSFNHWGRHAMEGMRAIHAHLS